MLEFDAALSTVVEVTKKTQNAEKSPAPAAPSGPLSAHLLSKMQRYWYAANYLCVGQIYLQDNPLLREPLTKAHIKPRLLGHWGTSAGQNFIYVHLNLSLIHILKGVESPERLLDETALFLHRVVADLPTEKQRMLDRLHHSDDALVGKKVLVVDDDVRNIFALSSVLERRGMTVLTCLLYTSFSN